MAPEVLYSSVVKIQLTKDKTIDINFPGLGGGGGSSKAKSDLIGVELFSDATEGCPAVRLYRKKNTWHLGAAAYVKPPEGEMPESWDMISKQPKWEMPRDFQAPCAALAVNSAMGSFGQASTEAIIQEMMHGTALVSEPDTAIAEPGKRRLGLKTSKPATPKPAQPATPARRPDFPEDGVPVSENGRRFVVRPFAEEDFHLCASLPEFQSLWLGRLLPEGKRPTASSIQLAESALMASVLAQPEFIAAKGSMLVIFVRNERIYFAGYKNGEPVLWRRCPNTRGYLAMREAVKMTLCVDEELIDSVLEESLIDPRPALEPFIHPVLEQLDLARAYLSGKHQMNVDKVMLVGLPCGAEHWRHYAEEALKIQIVTAKPFDGIQIDKGIDINHPTEFLVALGAALAASEVES